MLWVHRPAHKQTFVNKSLGTDGSRYCLCAQLLILFVYTCIFTYLHVTECGWNAAYLSLSVSHECVTASHPWLTLMTEPVYLVMQPGPITKSTQVHVCVCVCLCKTWPRGIQPDMPLRQGLAGFDQRVSCASCSSEDSWPQRLGRTSKAHRDRLGRCTETGTESMHAGERGCEVKPDCQSKPFSDSLQTKGSTHCTQSRHSGEEAGSLFHSRLQWNEKEKQICVNILRRNWERVTTRTEKSAVVLSSLQSQTAEPSRPHFSSSQLLDNCSPPGPTPSSPPHLPLLLGRKWSFVLLLKLITSPCIVWACTPESRPYCSSLQRFVLLVHYFTHALLFYQALFEVMLID